MSYSKLYSAIARGKWFIDFRQLEFYQNIVEQMMNKRGEGYDDKILSSSSPLTVLMSDGKAMNQGNSFNAAPNGSVAIIPIQGTMLKNGTMCSYGTMEIAQMIDEATTCKNITGTVLDIDSGGGSVDAIAPLVDAIKRSQAAGKPVIASCDLCCSAAYYVASYCNEIVANNNISAEFGSIGVMMSFRDYAEKYQKDGIKEHTIYSNLSEEKGAAFELAREGKYDKIKEEALDPLARAFRSTVQANRKDLKSDTAGILAGKTFYAQDALKIGLIDKIGTQTYAVSRVKELTTNAIIQEYITQI
ncbi:MAG: ClpP class periplasmic serine protease [Bacteroidetes bacterium]|nr:ClpP class periplasmic serine protease [Bacteroidota bacterium]